MPKVFISYSWTTPDHIEWVKQLGRELIESGIDVVLDKWDLKEGYDSNAFMERMVTDAEIDKVIMVCDRMYAAKSDSRRGGAGTEAQIITPALYGKINQDKFVAVIREKDEDGHALVPTYFKGRIYIDLLEEDTYATEFERLVRWVYGKPLDVKPALGKPPAYITEDSTTTRLATAAPFRRAMDAIKNSRPHAVPAAGEYLQAVLTELEKLRLGDDQTDFDDKVVASIESFTPHRNELIDLFIVVAQYKADDDMARVMHRFFEGLIPFMHRPPNAGQWHSWDFDNYRFIAIELLLYYLGCMIMTERFHMAAHLINTPFYLGEAAEGRSDPMTDITAFMQEIGSLEHRDQRLGRGRRSPEAALMSERCKGVPVQYQHLNTADLVLYINARRRSGHWFPFTLIGHRYRTIHLEMFARARSHAYFESIKGLLGVNNEREFVSFIQTLDASHNQSSGYNHMRGLSQLVGLDEIAVNVK